MLAFNYQLIFDHRVVGNPSPNSHGPPQRITLRQTGESLQIENFKRRQITNVLTQFAPVSKLVTNHLDIVEILVVWKGRMSFGSDPVRGDLFLQ